MLDMKRHSISARSFGLIVLGLLVSVLVLHARIIHVPSEQPSIQQGLNAASFGDTVLVADSMYNENIVWPSSDGILLLSEHGPQVTMINGGGNGRVVTFSGNYTRQTCIQGFTIAGGKTNAGAGILVQSGNPSIIGNRIENNECRGGRDYGGGIFIDYGASPLVMGNTIRSNTCSDTSTWNYGGGIYVDMNSRAEISYNLITGNVCSKGYWNYGAGIYVGLYGQPIIYQNTITDNWSKEGDRGHGAGIYADLLSAPLIFCNLVKNNTCNSDLWNYGAGVVNQGEAEIVNNTISGNTLIGGTWRFGGGVYMDSQTVVANNIIVNNSAAGGGGIFCDGGTALGISHNDVWNNTGGNYSGCSAGPGDFTRDPLFVSGAHGSFYLSQVASGQPSNSPCVDSGTSVLSESLEYYLGVSTTRTDSAPDATPWDMGYHYPQHLLVGIQEPLHRQAEAWAMRAIPNPFTSQVVFECGLLRNGTIEIYNALGRQVQRLRVEPGQVKVVWDTRGLRPGTYFYRFRSGLGSQTGRLVKV